MDWFERLTGFREGTYEETQRSSKSTVVRFGRSSTARATASESSNSCPFKRFVSGPNRPVGHPGDLR